MEFLNKINSGEKIDVGENVAIIGGGIYGLRRCQNITETWGEEGYYDVQEIGDR